MSKLAVANIIFETTESNRIEYTGNNVVRVRANGGLQIPFGTTDQRVSPEYGIIRYNTDLQTVEMYDAGGWYNMPTGGYVNNIYTVANSAYAAANNVGPQIAPTFNTANAAFNQANLAYTSSNVVYAAVNSAFGSINSNWTVTNTVYGVANAAFNAANNVGPQIAPAFNQANLAYTSSNSANSYANSTYVKLTSPNQTITGDLAITGNLTLLGNATTITSNNLIVNDSLIYLAANNDLSDILDIGFVGHYSNGTANLHTGLFRDHSSKQYFLFSDLAGPEPETINDLVPYANGMINAVLNANFVTSNLTLGGANAIVWIKSAYDTVNAAYTSSNADFTVSNAAFAAANSKVSTVAGTSGRITSSGTTGITLDLATAGLGAASYSSGISAMTVDAYGRVTSVTGSASYLTGITSGQVTTALGYTPYNATNPSGYITSSALTPYATLSGATFSGDVRSYRSAASTTGVYYFSQSGDYYIYWNGSAFNINGGYTTATGSMRSPIFYDSDDTSYYVNPAGSSKLSGIERISGTGSWTTDFQNTPNGTWRYVGDINGGTDCPTGGGWWVQNNYRHSNASNYWGVQVAWGWEDKANELYTRNVSGNVFGSWVRYSNSTNGGRVLLATLTGSNSTTLATTALAGYRYIEILFSNIVPVTTSTILQLQWYAGSYLATGYQQYLAIFNTGGSQGYNQTTYVDLCGGGRVSNSAGSGYCGRILLFNANQGTGFKQFIVDTGGLDSTTNYVNRTWGQGNLNTATAITGFQMFMSSGNISTGTVQVWGWN